MHAPLSWKFVAAVLTRKSVVTNQLNYRKRCTLQCLPGRFVFCGRRGRMPFQIPLASAGWDRRGRHQTEATAARTILLRNELLRWLPCCWRWLRPYPYFVPDLSRQTGWSLLPYRLAYTSTVEFVGHLFASAGAISHAADKIIDVGFAPSRSSLLLPMYIYMLMIPSTSTAGT